MASDWSNRAQEPTVTHGLAVLSSSAHSDRERDDRSEHAAVTTPGSNHNNSTSVILSPSARGDRQRDAQRSRPDSDLLRMGSPSSRSRELGPAVTTWLPGWSPFHWSSQAHRKLYSYIWNARTGEIGNTIPKTVIVSGGLAERNTIYSAHLVV